MRKLVTLFVVLPLAIVIVMFAVANRESVTLVFDPFDASQPAYALKLPLFLLLFAFTGLGVLIGGFAVWIRQRRWRTRARRAEAETVTLRERLADRRWPQEPPSQASPDNPAPLILPPAALGAISKAPHRRAP